MSYTQLMVTRLAVCGATADFGEDRTCEEKLCQQECTNLDGTGFICSCRPGYEVNPDSTYNCRGRRTTHGGHLSALPRDHKNNEAERLFSSPQTSMSASSTASVLRSAGTPRAATAVAALLATGRSETAKCARPKVRVAPRSNVKLKAVRSFGKWLRYDEDMTDEIIFFSTNIY